MCLPCTNCRLVLILMADRAQDLKGVSVSTASTDIRNPICIVAFEADVIRDCALYMADMTVLAEAIDPDSPDARVQFAAQLPFLSVFLVRTCCASQHAIAQARSAHSGRCDREDDQ